MASSYALLPGTGASQSYSPYAGVNGGALYDDQATLDNSGLTLANGMTAGWGDADGNTQNPSLPTSSQTGAPINPYGGMPRWPISRVGFMRSLPGALGGTSQQYTLHFIYNPGEVDVSFSMNQSQYPPNYLLSNTNVTDNTIAAPITNAQNVHWQLLFDRTYDMMYDADPDGNRGVLKDIGALYLMLGTFEGGADSAAVPMSTLVEVIFGQTNNGNIWGFTGFLNAVSITYPIFRHNMIPSRALVDINMTTVFSSPGTPATTVAAAAANAPATGTATFPSTDLPLDTGSGTSTTGVAASLPSVSPFA
jgi:hypothetical protein